MKIISLIETNLTLLLSLISSAVTWLVAHFYNRGKRKADTQKRFLEQIDSLNNRVLDLNEKYFIMIEQIARLQVENALLKSQLRQFEAKQCIHDQRKCI